MEVPIKLILFVPEIKEDEEDEMMMIQIKKPFSASPPMFVSDFFMELQATERYFLLTQTFSKSCGSLSEP